MQLKNPITLSLLAGAILALAHPGHHEELDSPALKLYKRDVGHGLAKCATQLETSGLQARAEQRRKETVELHRRRQNQLHIRDTDAVLNKSHQATRPVSPFMPADEIFKDSSKKACLLGPTAEGETGPYWIPGERVRSEIREGEPGVPVILEQQYIDVETCKPIPQLYAELWGCNATGVYSGLVVEGNGNPSDLGNRDRTFLRGIQQTDAEGVVTFDTLFPGHYDGRTTHYHNIAHFHAKRLPNNTIAGGTVGHVAQIFWDQDAIDRVESTYPYNTNEIPITLNAVDRVVRQETEYSDSDPMLNYAFLGEAIEDGLFAWITVAVNLSAVHYPYYTNVWTAEGGVEVDGTEDGDPRVVDGGLPQSA
ncbi:Intradiol ring-cleavage dioxygenase [Aspergillus cavernicola]|uniref:Intradiol ring-cleavage dioxygenase n=1 Tax=Aspergillus cavernicola TaxID=176166 RepID=A0ABR4IFG1_9EURO